MRTPAMNVPIIRLEIESMRHTIATALSEHTLLIDANIQEAVKRLCDPENISRIIDEQVGKVMSDVIRDEITDFFWRGKGRQALREAVCKILEDNNAHP